MKNSTRRDFLKATALTSAGVLFPSLLHAAAKPLSKRPPNFLFIFIDDMGWADVGYNHNKFVETPNIDALAASGVVFTNAYSNAPNCAPSRACLMSGGYTPRHGIYTVGRSERGKSHNRKLIPTKNTTWLDPKVVTIAEALKPSGYVCGHFGKWHLGSDKKQVDGISTDPGSQGFDDVLVTQRASKKAKTDAHHVAQITDRAVNFMKNNADKPFFCYVAHNTIHSPLLEEAALIAKYKAKSQNPPNSPVIAAMIETLDKNVARLLKSLDDLNIADNTVVFFFSDNGGVFGFSDMGPLRGGKGMLYEGGVREPMIVRYPGVTKAGTKCDVPVMGIDFYPTILDVANAPKPSGQILDGKSFLPLLKGRKNLDRKAIFWHFPAYLEGNYGWKHTWRTTPAGAVRAGDWKLIEYFEDGRLELYNLKNDVGEKNNLAEKMPAKTEELHNLLKNWRRSLNAPVPKILNPLYNPNLEPKRL